MYPNLKLAIFKSGLQQNQLSKILGINEVNLSKIIRGHREPSNSQRQLLANYLGADERWLFEKFESNIRPRLGKERSCDAKDNGRELS
jgi:transcriptional regulator with XRE-family HTH domain